MLRNARSGCATLLCAVLCISSVARATEPRLIDLQGKAVTLAQYKGHPLLLNFWATWCVPCLKEMPELNQFARDVRSRKFVVLGVAADERQEVAGFIKKLGIEYPIAVGDPDAVFAWSESLGNSTAGLPFSALLDANGKVTWAKTGGQLTAQELHQVIGRLKGRPGGW
jgi:thiol-disulfide isomerase/thioredoxin